MFDKMKMGLGRFREGAAHWFRRCNGPDQMGLCLIVTALICSVLGQLLRFGLLSLASTVFYIWAIYRMLSQDKAKRFAENQRFMQRFGPMKTEASQAMVRLKNAKTYKYFKCPGCQSRLRMPRGVGEKTVTCSKCGHAFKMKA